MRCSKKCIYVCM